MGRSNAGQLPDVGLSESIFLEAAGIKNLLVNDYPIT